MLTKRAGCAVQAWTDVFSFISRMMIKAAYGCQDASG